jgi:membrane protease YdiL (CAAX protease family)
VQECTPPKLSGDRAEVAERDQGAAPPERLARLTGARWPGALLSLAAFVAFHLHGWHLGHVLGVVLPLGAVMTSLYLWRRDVVFVIITHFLLDLPLVLVALGVFAPM